MLRIDKNVDDVASADSIRNKDMEKKVFEENMKPMPIQCKETPFSIDCHPGKDAIVVGDVSGALEVFEYSTKENKSVLRLEAHKGAVQSVVFSDDGNSIISVSSEGDIKIHAFPNGELTWSVEKAHPRKVFSVIQATSNLIATGDENGMIKVWDIKKKAPVYEFDEHGDAISSFDYNDNLGFLYAASLDGSISVMDIKQKVEDPLMDISEISTNEKEYVAVVELQAGEKTLCATSDGHFESYPYGKWHGQPQRWNTGLESIATMVYLTEKNVCCASDSGRVAIFHMSDDAHAKFHQSSVVGNHDGYVQDIALASDGQYVVTCGIEDNLLKFWSLGSMFQTQNAFTTLEVKEEEEEEGKPTQKRKAREKAPGKEPAKKKKRFNSARKAFFADMVWRDDDDELDE